ncbi:MAG: hypothetical protein JRF69_11225, partial [Deltaproteobacteria bacterium]|nr:hypothetical protein [Deltaproteobacteria bacterium]
MAEDKMNNSDISRRAFLLGSVAATVSMLLASCGSSDQPGAEDLDAVTLSATRLPTWVARKADPSDDGTELSTPEVILPVDAWHSAVVPGTVLATLVASGQVPDPYFGLNNKQITDLHEGVDEYVYWFVSDFRLDSADWANAESVWLRFRGINYSAKVYLNGTELTPDDALTGMFLRHELNITKAIRRGANNRLAVLVTPPQPAGHP